MFLALDRPRRRDGLRATDGGTIGVRHPGQVGAVIRLDLATGNEVAHSPAGLPAAVVIAGETAWVTDYESGELLGFDR